MVYLDWAATSPPDREILEEAFRDSLGRYGNPSSAHGEGRLASDALESARRILLASLFPQGKPAGSIHFTGSGTEADQIPLLSLFSDFALGLKRTRGASSPPHILVSSIEHPAVFSQALHLSALGIEVQFLDPDSRGRLDPRRVAENIRPETRLVAVMAVNNETGAVQDIEGIGKAIGERLRIPSARQPVRKPGGPAQAAGKDIAFHVDCVQALGKTDLDFLGSPAGPSSAAFSAHKLRGPKGIGALWLASSLDVVAKGGGQEGGIRSGTENLYGALAFASCSVQAQAKLEAALRHARDLEKLLIQGIRAIPGAATLPLDRQPGEAAFSPYILSASFPGLGGEVLARALSDAGIAVSTGSACSSRKKGERRILKAMGLDGELSFSAIRISTGETSSPKDIEDFLSRAEDLFRHLKT